MYRRWDSTFFWNKIHTNLEHQQFSKIWFLRAFQLFEFISWSHHSNLDCKLWNFLYSEISQGKNSLISHLLFSLLVKFTACGTSNIWRIFSKDTTNEFEFCESKLSYVPQRLFETLLLWKYYKFSPVKFLFIIGTCVKVVVTVNSIHWISEHHQKFHLWSQGFIDSLWYLRPIPVICRLEKYSMMQIKVKCVRCKSHKFYTIFEICRIINCFSH